MDIKNGGKMENSLNMSEIDTFNTLKYKRYTSHTMCVGTHWVLRGSTYWVNDAGQLHRENGPAVEYKNGLREYYHNGKYIRNDLSFLR